MENQNNDNNSISLHDLFVVIWKNIILVAIVTVMITLAGILYTTVIATPQYKSTASIIVAVESSSSNVDYDYTQSQKAVITVADSIKESQILGEVAAKYDDLSVAALQKKIEVKNSSNSMKITITVTDSDPKRAKELAQAITDRCIEEAVSVKNNGKKGVFFFAAHSIVVTSNATDAVYASPNKKLYVLVSFVLGLVVSFVIVFIKDFMSTKYKTRAEIQSTYKEKVLGIFPDDKKKNPKKGELKDVALVNPSIRSFEPYNKLLSNIKYSNLENPAKSLLLTSTVPNELKSTVAANLAYCIKNNNEKVIIIDLDLRCPRLHQTFGVEKNNGIVEYVAGEANIDSIIKQTNYGVDIITSGKEVMNPVPVLETTKLKELINDLKAKYDYVIIDTPPTLACSDSQIVATYADGVLFNVALNTAKKKDIQDTLKMITVTGGNVIGISITKADIKTNSYYYAYSKETK